MPEETPESLSEAEQAQLVSHLGWPLLDSDYTEQVLMPKFWRLSDAQLPVIRGYLTELNNTRQKLSELIDGVDLVEVKGLRFSEKAEARAWAQYRDWVFLLASALGAEPNPDIFSGYGQASRSSRMIYHDHQ